MPFQLPPVIDRIRPKWNGGTCIHEADKGQKTGTESVPTRCIRFSTVFVSQQNCFPPRRETRLHVGERRPRVQGQGMHPLRHKSRPSSLSSLPPSLGKVAARGKAVRAWISTVNGNSWSKYQSLQTKHPHKDTGSLTSATTTSVSRGVDHPNQRHEPAKDKAPVTATDPGSLMWRTGSDVWRSRVPAATWAGTCLFCFVTSVTDKWLAKSSTATTANDLSRNQS